ncbi:hypothetical protein Cgig2_029463 [Carnegiea gigantea]|uniref:Uncharacterized protein n=1 Tax=Carnegiea gigantea TaxID=171969 RepID=A0A9Q1KIN9_9CARY|nr:hypothetical protein Cgig2_029463 [Carnegiea gigantea]
MLQPIFLGRQILSYKISRETADRRSLSSLKLSQVVYDKIKQGHKIKFFDQYSMVYMTVRVSHTVSPCREDNIMHEDEQEDGKQTDNVIPLTTKLHVGHCKGKHTRTKKARPRKQTSTVPNSLDSATRKTREDIKIGRRLKRWGRTTPTYMDQDTNIKAACNERKFKLPTLKDNLIIKKHVLCRYSNEEGCIMVSPRISTDTRLVDTSEVPHV